MVRLDLERNCDDSEKKDVRSVKVKVIDKTNDMTHLKTKKDVRSVKVKVIDRYDALIDGYKRCGRGA